MKMDVTSQMKKYQWFITGIIAAVVFIVRSNESILDIDALWAIPLVIIALILGGLFILGAGKLGKLAEQRTKKLKNFAEQMGMEFSVEDEWDIGESLPAFDMFWEADITNVLSGDSEQLGYGEEFEVTVLEFGHSKTSFSSFVSRRSEYIQQTVICFHSPQLSLPRFSMRPEEWHHKIGSGLGYQDIDFESHQTGAEFSKKYLLRGKDEQWMTEEKIRVLFTDKILTFFAAHPDKVFVGGSGDQLIFYREGNLIEPEDTPAFIEEGLEVFRLFASSQPN